MGAGLAEEEDKDEEIHHVSRTFARRKLRTVTAYLMFFGMGVTSAVHGPTMVNLKELLGTDTVHLSMAMASLSIGYLLAAIVCGLLFHKFDSELQFSLAGLLMSISLIAAPWSRDVYGFMVACAVTGFGMSYIDTGGNAIMLSLWSRHRAKDPLMQGMHLIWSVGSTLSPFLLRPFLVEFTTNTTDCRLNTSAIDITGYSASASDDTRYSESASDNMGLSSNQTGSGVSCSDHDITLVRYAYVVVGGVVLFVALLYVIIYCILGHHLFRLETRHDTGNVTILEYELTWCFRLGFLALLFVFFFLNLILERIGGDYLSLFVVEGLGWSVKRGAVLTAAYWGAHGFGRILGVFISICMPPKLMLFCTLTCTALGYTALLFVDVLPEVGVFASVMVAGMGVSTVFPSMLLWVSSYVSSSSVLSAVCITGASMGTIVGYPLVGALLESLGHMWYVYSLLVSCVLILLLLVTMHVYSLAAVRKKTTGREEIQEL